MSIGEWKDDMRSGSGKYYYNNGDFYDGQWDNHVRHGVGTYIYASSGLQYSGAWKDGKRDGEGEVTRVENWTSPIGGAVSLYINVLYICTLCIFVIEFLIEEIDFFILFLLTF